MNTNLGDELKKGFQIIGGLILFVGIGLGVSITLLIGFIVWLLI